MIGLAKKLQKRANRQFRDGLVQDAVNPERKSKEARSSAAFRLIPALDYALYFHYWAPPVTDSGAPPFSRP